jgi:hypothetical protein
LSPTEVLDVSGDVIIGRGGGGTFFVDVVNNKVGIGTTAPSYTLEINGNFMVRDNISQSGLYTNIGSGTGQFFRSQSNIAWSLGNPDTSQSSGFTVNNSYLGYYYGSGPLALGANSAEVIRITTTGNVGIGTTGPVEKLDVSGDVIFGGSSPRALFVDASNNRIGVGNKVPGFSLDISGDYAVGSTTTLGKELMTVIQNDTDQPFMDYRGKSAADASSSITTRTTATLAGYVKMEINGVTYWMPFYNEPSA